MSDVTVQVEAVSEDTAPAPEAVKASAPPKREPTGLEVLGGITAVILATGACLFVVASLCMLLANTIHENSKHGSSIELRCEFLVENSKQAGAAPTDQDLVVPYSPQEFRCHGGSVSD